MKRRRRILVVGGLAAGPSAAAKAKRTNPSAEVTLFEATETVAYGICEAPYAIAGLITDESRLVSYTPQRLRDEKGIDVKTLHLVESINPSRHAISVRDLRERRLELFEYDKLIIATGASPKNIGLKGEDARNVFHLSSREDTTSIMKFLSEETPRQAVIIGGGYIGMEMAESLRARKLDVTIVHRRKLPLAGLEPEAREQIVQELKNNDVQFITNARVESLIAGGDDRVTHVVTNKGSHESGIVIVSAGVAPNVGLARNARIRLGLGGGILTDERQMTSLEDIYAAGDCCEVKNLVTGKPMYLPLASVASRAARVAGENAAGGQALFKGAIRAIAVKVFDLEVAQVGISLAEAEESRFHTATEFVSAYNQVGIMPGSSKIFIKLIFDTQSGRILGANVFGAPGAVHRANILGVAIQHHLTIDELSRLDLIYAPTFAPLWDPILVAANQARKVLRRK